LLDILINFNELTEPQPRNFNIHALNFKAWRCPLVRSKHIAIYSI